MKIIKNPLSSNVNPLDKKLIGKTQIEFEKYIIEHGVDFKNNVIVSYGNT